MDLSSSIPSSPAEIEHGGGVLLLNGPDHIITSILFTIYFEPCILRLFFFFTFSVDFLLKVAPIQMSKVLFMFLSTEEDASAQEKLPSA